MDAIMVRNDKNSFVECLRNMLNIVEYHYWVIPYSIRGWGSCRSVARGTLVALEMGTFLEHRIFTSSLVRFVVHFCVCL